MTFAEFQASRTSTTDVGAVTNQDMGAPDGGSVPGNIYAGSLYISARQDWWTKEAKAQGAWHLILERDEYISDDLDMLERKLWQWAEDYIC